MLFFNCIPDDRVNSVDTIRGDRNILTHKLQKAKVGAKRLQSTKFYAMLAALTVLIGTLYLSPAISSLTNSVVIESSGQISTDSPTITAASGYWRDIQDAIDAVVAAGGIGNVIIPEGTWDFVNVGEGWSGARVVAPAGVSLFGAPTERTSGLPYDGIGMNPNDQVVEWKTILRLPWDVPGSWTADSSPPPKGSGPRTPSWFQFIGDGDPNKPSRFSDIKLVGYRSIDPNSKMVLRGIYVRDVANFRVDHVYFEHIAGESIQSWASRGVIDHTFFVNNIGYVVGTWDTCTVGYGVSVNRGNGDLWDNNIANVLGQYTDYTVFIEDSYFEKWRHCIAANRGAHYVIRHSSIKDDYGYGSLDAHGWGVYPDQVGTRAVEIYNVLMIDAIQYPFGTMIRGGAGVAFNNTVGDGTYLRFLYFTNEATWEKCWVNDWWIWNNTMLGGIAEIQKYDPEGNIIEGENYFRHAPHTFNYEPYSYPHPLTLDSTP